MGRKKKTAPTPGLHLPEGAAPRRTASPRVVQVGEAIKKALGEVLTDGTVKDPRLSTAMVTVTGVEMTPDLRLARVYFSAFPDEAIADVFRGLRSAASELRRAIADRVGLRFTPSLVFFVDESIARGAKIEALLHSIRDEDRERDDASVDGDSTDAAEEDREG